MDNDNPPVNVTPYPSFSPCIGTFCSNLVIEAKIQFEAFRFDGNLFSGYPQN